MRTGFIALVVILLASAAFTQDAPADAKAPADDKAAAPTFEHKSGEEVLINLQGENKDVWIVSFFQPDDNHAEVKEEITKAMKDGLPKETFKYGEVSLASGYAYEKLFETLDLVGEPKRGNTTPQVLVMKGGEGYVIHGPHIGEAVVKRFAEVKENKLFAKK